MPISNWNLSLTNYCSIFHLVLAHENNNVNRVPIGSDKKILSVYNSLKKIFNCKHQNDIGTKQVLTKKSVSMCDTLHKQLEIN